MRGHGYATIVFGKPGFDYPTSAGHELIAREWIKKFKEITSM